MEKLYLYSIPFPLNLYFTRARPTYMRPESGKRSSQLFLILGILRAAIYLILGVFLLIYPHLFQLSALTNYFIAFALIAYGLFRAWRVIAETLSNQFTEEE